MSDAPIRVDSRAQVGDPAISPIEREVLGRRWKARDKRRSFWGFTLLVALGSMLAWMPIELLIWSIAGNLPYFSAGIDSTALLVGIALGAGFAVWLFFTGHRIARWEGAFFLLYYGAYTVYLILNASAHDSLPAFSAMMLEFVLPLTALTLAVAYVRYVAKMRGEMA